MIVKCPNCGTVIPKDKEEKEEEEGVRRGRETAEYLKSQGYMGGNHLGSKKDKKEEKEAAGVITAPMMEME